MYPVNEPTRDVSKYGRETDVAKSKLNASTVIAKRHESFGVDYQAVNQYVRK